MPDTDSPELMSFKIETLTNTLDEIRKRLVEVGTSIGGLNLLNQTSNQTAEAVARLRDELKVTMSTITSTRDELEKSIAELDTGLSKTLSSNKEAQNLVNAGVDRKFNIAYGVLLCATALSTLLTGFVIYEIKVMTTKLEDSYQYTQTLKTLKADDLLRQLMRQQPAPQPPTK